MFLTLFHLKKTNFSEYKFCRIELNFVKKEKTNFVIGKEKTDFLFY